jgi:hypothetical protein
LAAVLLPARPRVLEVDAALVPDVVLNLNGNTNGNGNGHRVLGSRRLREQPVDAAAVVGSVQGAVDVIRVVGDWAEVRAAESSGWLRRNFLDTTTTGDVQLVVEPAQL